MLKVTKQVAANFLISPRMEISQLLWAPGLLLDNPNCDLFFFFYFLSDVSLVATTDHYFLSFHCVTPPSPEHVRQLKTLFENVYVFSYMSISKLPI